MLQFILFANVTTILFSDKDISSKVDLINTEVKEVTNWFKTNKLSINASKTNFMIMGTTHQTSKPENNIKVILDNVELSRVNKTKFLGVLIDEDLIWKDHIPQMQYIKQYHEMLGWLINWSILFQNVYC